MSSATLSDLREVSTDLWDPHLTARTGPYLRALWKRRAYMRFVARSALRERQVNTVLGNVWHLLNPALSVAVYYLVFGVLLETNRGVDNFILYLSVGVFMFGFTQRATQSGASSITGNLGLVKAVRFPRAVLPITTSITEALSSLSSMVVLFGVAAITGEAPRWQWAVLPVVFAVQFVFNTGAALVAARMTVHVRDTTQILPFLFRMLFYGSGVVFSVSEYASGSHELWFILNPMYCFLTLSRWCVLGEVVQPAVILSAAVWTVLLLTAGFAWFKAGEELYARD